MKKPFEPLPPKALRDRLIGLGERSFGNSYYPALQERLGQLERFRSLLDHSSELILMVDLASRRIVDANESACRALDYPADELIGRSVEAVVALERLEWPEPDTERADCRTVSSVLHRRDAAEIPVEMVLCMDRFAGSDYVVVVARDITERLRAEERLLKSEMEKALILESTEELIVYHDAGMRILWANRAAGRSLSLFPGELAGRRCWELWHRRSTPCERCPVVAALRTGEPQSAEITSPDGKVWFIRGYPARNPRGEVEGIVEFCLDITERKRAEEALRQSDRMKTEFISTAAHELRTPLTSILGFSQVLLEQEGLAAAERREFLTYIYEKARGLAEIVGDLLDIARIASGQGLTLHPAPCTAGELAALVGPFVQSSPDPSRFTLAIADEQTRLSADPGKLTQVFENLLSNAAKYSPAGGPIRVEGRRLAGVYEFSVVDRGVGMTAEQVARVFDKFYRVDASNTAVGGLGLGMSIVRNIVEAHSGRIWVESRLGEGTTVRFTLPLAEAAAGGKEQVE